MSGVAEGELSSPAEADTGGELSPGDQGGVRHDHGVCACHPVQGCHCHSVSRDSVKQRQYTGKSAGLKLYDTMFF